MRWTSGQRDVPPESFNLSSIFSLSLPIGQLFQVVDPQQHLIFSSIPPFSSFRSSNCRDRPSSVAAVWRNAQAEGEARGVSGAEEVSWFWDVGEGGRVEVDDDAVAAWFMIRFYPCVMYKWCVEIQYKSMIFVYVWHQGSGIISLIRGVSSFPLLSWSESNPEAFFPSLWLSDSRRCNQVTADYALTSWGMGTNVGTSQTKNSPGLLNPTSHSIHDRIRTSWRLKME